jgi:HEAT repeat protein
VRANAVTIIFDTSYFGGQMERARPYLLEALADPDPDVVARAADALAGWFLDDAEVKATLSTYVPVLRTATASVDSITQAHAVSALEKMGARPPAESMLRSSNAGLRRRGIEQAAKAQDLSAASMLITIARTDPVLVIRMEAIPVAAELAAPDVRDQFLGELIESTDDDVGAAAIRAAGATRATALAKKIEAVLSAVEGNRTGAAITALAALGDTDAAPAIAAHLNDHFNTQLSAKLALDTLVGPARALPTWQAWAREKHYLP